MQIKIISSLEKVIPGRDLNCEPISRATTLKGEKFNFQLAYKYEDGGIRSARINIDSELKNAITLYCVGNVPVLLPTLNSSDGNYITDVPCILPDPLFKLDGFFNLANRQWRSIWAEVEVSDIVSGVYPIKLSIVDDNNDQVLGQAVFELEVLEAELPKQNLIHTEWFHNDCLATYYGVEVFSEKHWELIENYIESAVRYGINMLLTPIFTPPLDTKIGAERPTVQLIKIKTDNSIYKFDFSLLKRYIDLARKKGIEYFEISHLFTQWGAGFAPKIVATINDIEQKIFGWETPAGDAKYVEFLSKCLSELKVFLKKENILEKCYFHISDEPYMSAIESYRTARSIVSPILDDCNIIDALSDYDFYEKGLIKKPIPANNHIETFINKGVKNLWTYYCCSQSVDVSNRFLAMPSARNRILGWQLFKFNIEGFLQWGFNFWYSSYSIKQINPYLVTDAMESFPAGDAYMVYPGEDGKPVPSIKQLVFNEALQDNRALKLLEEKMGHDNLVNWLDEECGYEMTFKKYPQEASWILTMREKINRKIIELI